MTHLAKVLAATPHDLNDLFAQLMQQKTFQRQVVKEADSYREGKTDHEMLERAFDEIYPAWMNDFEKRGKFDGDKVKIYRGISATSLERVSFKKLGVFWTWDIKKAANYSNKNTKENLFIVCGEISLSSIDLKNTLSKVVWPGYTLVESEREFHLKAGSKVEIHQVLDAKGKNLIDKPFEATV